jgi:hypothetical protein
MGTAFFRVKLHGNQVILLERGGKPTFIERHAGNTG